MVENAVGSIAGEYGSEIVIGALESVAEVLVTEAGEEAGLPPHADVNGPSAIPNASTEEMAAVLGLDIPLTSFCATNVHNTLSVVRPGWEELQKSNEVWDGQTLVEFSSATAVVVGQQV